MLEHGTNFDKHLLGLDKKYDNIMRHELANRLRKLGVTEVFSIDTFHLPTIPHKCYLDSFFCYTTVS